MQHFVMFFSRIQCLKPLGKPPAELNCHKLGAIHFSLCWTHDFHGGEFYDRGSWLNFLIL